MKKYVYKRKNIILHRIYIGERVYVKHEINQLLRSRTHVISAPVASNLLVGKVYMYSQGFGIIIYDYSSQTSTCQFNSFGDISLLPQHV